MFRKIFFCRGFRNSLSQQPPLPLLPEEKFEPLPLLPPTVSKGYIIYISHISNLELVIYQTIYGICIKIDGSTNAKLISIASTWYLSGFSARSLRTIWFSASACSNWSMRKLCKLSYAREVFKLSKGQKSAFCCESLVAIYQTIGVWLTRKEYSLRSSPPSFATVLLISFFSSTSVFKFSDDNH